MTDDLRETIAFFAGQVVKRWSLIYSDVESLHDWRLSCAGAGAEYIRVVPWIRWSMPQLSGDRPPQSWEAVSVFHPKGRKRWNGPGNLKELEPAEDDDGVLWLPALDELCLRGEDKHKTEKPLDQALRLVSWFSEPGETVLDPTMGRGTIGVACALLGRDFVGAELSVDEQGNPTDEYERAEARILKAVAFGVRGLSDRDAERLERWQLSNVRTAPESFTAPAQARHARVMADVERTL